MYKTWPLSVSLFVLSSFLLYLQMVKCKHIAHAQDHAKLAVEARREMKPAEEKANLPDLDAPTGKDHIEHDCCW